MDHECEACSVEIDEDTFDMNDGLCDECFEEANQITVH